MLKHLLFLLLVCCLNSSGAYAQAGLIQTAHLPSNPAGYSPEIIIATADSGAWLIGNQYPGMTNSHRHQRTFTKVDKYGNAQLQKYYTFQNFSNNQSHTEIFAACATLDQGMVLCGLTGNQFFAIKLTAAFDTVWCRADNIFSTYYGMEPRAIVATRDSGFVIAGSWKWFDIAIIKLDKNGNKVWSKLELESSGTEAKLNCVTEGPDSSIYAGGQQPEDQNKSNPLLLKLDKNGGLVWKKVFLSSQTINNRYSSFLGLHFIGNKLYSSVFTGANLFGVLNTNGEVNWLKKLDLSFNGFGFNRSTNSIFDLDNNNIYANINGALYAFDSIAQCKFEIIASGLKPVNFAALAGNKIMGIGIANHWTTDITLPTRAYTLTINDAFSPLSNRCNPISQVSLSNYAMRDSVINSTLLDSLRLQAMSLVETGSISIKSQSGCDLTAGINNNLITHTNFLVQPNPSDAFFKITLQNTEVTKISVLSSDARLILCQEIFNAPDSFQIDLSEQAPGIYFCIAETKTGEKFSIKLVRSF